MKTGYKIFVGFVALLFLAGLSANANKMSLFAAVHGNDTTKVVKEVTKIPETSIVDEVIWVVGDEPILKSDVEAMRLQGEADGMNWSGDPDCSIPEQLAVQ